MAIRWYRPVSGGTELELYIDPGLYTEAQDQLDLALFEEAFESSDSLREQLAAANGFSNLGEYDAYLEDQIWEIKDRLDYYAYETTAKNVTVADGAWFTPEAIEEFCGEHPTNVAANSIDGDNVSIWQHFQTHQHSIVYRLRDYPKKITKVRFRYGNTEPEREQLQDLNIFAARNLNMIDDAGNQVLTNANPTWPVGGGVWVEVVLDTPKTNARYIKLLFDTADASNNGQVREFAVWVETREP
jgi:hypothetical protein